MRIFVCRATLRMSPRLTSHTDSTEITLRSFASVRYASCAVTAPPVTVLGRKTLSSPTTPAQMYGESDGYVGYVNRPAQRYLAFQSISMDLLGFVPGNVVSYYLEILRRARLP